MSDITVREAVQILSAVSQQLRAAKRLEDALKVGLTIEEIVKTKTSEKDVLEVEISKLHIQLSKLGDEFEEEEKKVEVALGKSSDIVSVAQEKARNAEVEADKRMEQATKASDKYLKELEDVHSDKMKELEEEIKGKDKELVFIEAKIQDIKNELALMKKRLD